MHQNVQYKNQKSKHLEAASGVACSTMFHDASTLAVFLQFIPHLDPLGYQPAGYHASMHGCHLHSDIILLLALQHHLGSRKENQMEYCSMRVFVLFLLLCPLYESSSLYSLLISCWLTRDHDHES